MSALELVILVLLGVGLIISGAIVAAGMSGNNILNLLAIVLTSMGIGVLIPDKAPDFDHACQGEIRVGVFESGQRDDDIDDLQSILDKAMCEVDVHQVVTRP